MQILWQWLFPEKKTDLRFTLFIESSPLNVPFTYTALYQYSDSLRKALHEIKFKKNQNLINQISLQIIKDYMPHEIDLIVPIPLHPLRLQERGFDHTYELIHKFAYFHKIPLGLDIVSRSTNTKPMFELNPVDRQTEVQDSFDVWPNQGNRLTGKNILLFDDIITTGNTLVAVYTELMKYQPKSIIALGVTRPSFRQ